jgi:hypothetical protein
MGKISDLPVFVPISDQLCVRILQPLPAEWISKLLVIGCGPTYDYYLVSDGSAVKVLRCPQNSMKFLPGTTISITRLRLILLHNLLIIELNKFSKISLASTPILINEYSAETIASAFVMYDVDL